MHEREDHDERSHQRIWELLPWYANGTLSAEDRKRVEGHAAGCRRCQDEIEACRQMAAAVKGAGDAAPSPHPVQLQRVLARIDEAERIPAGGEGSDRAAGFAGPRRLPLRSLISATPRPLRGALLAQAAIIVLLVGLVTWGELRSRVSSPSAGPATFQTLSDPAPAAAPGGTVSLRLMFSPRATEKEIRELLLAVHGEITAGPSPFGVYTVEVAAAGHPVSVVLTHLRTEPVVVLAEPVSGGDAARGSR
ncbi:MAG TPA: zf-HC2 domain-containing protein [Thermoanaerobaculia bacterium]|nr:zf-HC2 domain-containing protein [Thermoanaerobaculia bacterium]